MTREAKRLYERQRKNIAAAEKRREQAREFAAALARVFAEADPSLRGVIGFGSVFESARAFRLDSDLDLAIRGGDWGKLWSLIPKNDFSVSLIELDLQPQAFVEGVLEKGVVLYEKR